MPHTGLLVRNERLSIELGHLLLNSNVTEIILQLELLQTNTLDQRPGCLDLVPAWQMGEFKGRRAQWAISILRPPNTKRWVESEAGEIWDLKNSWTEGTVKP